MGMGQGQGGRGQLLCNPSRCTNTFGVIFPKYDSLSLISFYQMGGWGWGRSLPTRPRALSQRKRMRARSGIEGQALCYGLDTGFSAQLANEETKASLVLRAFSLGRSVSQMGTLRLEEVASLP